MSQTILSVFILLASQILPMIGVSIGNDQLTSTISTLVAIISGVWIWVRRVKQGDVTVGGSRKQ